MGRIHKVLLWQFIMTAAIASLLYAVRGEAAALAAVFGGVVAIALSLLLKMMVDWLNDQLAESRRVNKGILAVMIVPRMLLVIASFALGISLLRLPAAPMVAAFAVVYLVYWMDWKFSRAEKTEAS